MVCEDGDSCRRRSIRLREYPYNAGAYFFTICSYDRQCAFGRIKDGEVVLSPTGTIVCDEWTRSSALRKEIALDAFVIMPNHMHGIVFILDDGKGAGARRAPLRLMRGAKSLGSFVAGFKSSVTARVKKEIGCSSHVWQRNYYEHVIRGERDLKALRDYTAANPATWEQDENYPLK